MQVLLWFCGVRHGRLCSYRASTSGIYSLDVHRRTRITKNREGQQKLFQPDVCCHEKDRPKLSSNAVFVVFCNSLLFVLPLPTFLSVSLFFVPRSLAACFYGFAFISSGIAFVFDGVAKFRARREFVLQLHCSKHR